MTQATHYTRTTGFADDERNNAGGRSTVATADVDFELDAIGQRLNLTGDNLALLQRDDGVMRDGAVPVSALGADTLKLISGAGNPRGAWLTATAYIPKDLVTQGGNTYICVVAHTSGVFATDLGAVKWILYQIGANPAAAAVPFSPTSNITSSTTQAAIVEVDTNARTRDTQAASDLADTTTATKNSGLIGFNYALAYGAGTLGKWIKDLATSTTSVGATFIGFLQAGAGALLRTVQSKLRDTVSVKDFGATGDGSTDDYTAITAAIAAVSTGGTLIFPAGTYVHSLPLVFKNFVNYRGAGAVGTVLKYTGSGSDAIQVNNPINSSTAAIISVSDMVLQATTKTAGKANFADTGSSYLYFDRVNFTGAAIGLIFDQSEIVSVNNCIFGSHSQTSMWLVNGASRTVGATGNFTNRINVQNTQFNEALTCDLITDDGGHVRTYSNNNFESGRIQIRICGADAVQISNNEMENSATNAITFETTKSTLGGGAATGAGGPTTISSNLIQTSGATAVNFTTGCLTSLTYSGNVFPIAAGGTSPDNSPGTFVNPTIASGNTNSSGGTNPYNNINVDKTFVPLLGGNTTLGVGTYTTQLGRYLQNGSQVQFEIQLTWTAHTGTGTQMLVSLPLKAFPNGPTTIPVDAASTGIALPAGSSLVAVLNYASAPFGGIAGVIQLYSSSAGVLTGLAMTGSGTLFLSGAYQGR
jgi:hypothetical protein